MAVFPHRLVRLRQSVPRHDRGSVTSSNPAATMSFIRVTSKALHRCVPRIDAVGMRIRRCRVQTCGA